MSDERTPDSAWEDRHNQQPLPPPRSAQPLRSRYLLIGLLLGGICGIMLGGGAMWAWFMRQQQAMEQAHQGELARVEQIMALRENVTYHMDPATTVQHPPQADCSLRSVRGTHASTVVFRNTSDRTMAINWLDYDGNEVPYATLLPGDVLVQSTFDTHPWCIRDSTNAIVLAVTATDQPQVVNIP